MFYLLDMQAWETRKTSWSLDSLLCNAKTWICKKPGNKTDTMLLETVVYSVLVLFFDNLSKSVFFFLVKSLAAVRTCSVFGSTTIYICNLCLTLFS